MRIGAQDERKRGDRPIFHMNQGNDRFDVDTSHPGVEPEQEEPGRGPLIIALNPEDDRGRI